MCAGLRHCVSMPQLNMIFFMKPVKFRAALKRALSKALLKCAGNQIKNNQAIIVLL
jgi:hypothetical protein